MALESYETFDAVKTRLDEIVDAVNAEDLPLDDALALYEEAVALGLRASDLLETDIEAQREQDEEQEAAVAAGDADAVGENAMPAADAEGALSAPLAAEQPAEREGAAPATA